MLHGQQGQRDCGKDDGDQVTCSKCGAEITRMVSRKNATCDNCKRENRNAYFRKWREEHREEHREMARNSMYFLRKVGRLEDDEDDLGPDIPIGLKSVRGKLKVTIK